MRKLIPVFLLVAAAAIARSADADALDASTSLVGAGVVRPLFPPSPSETEIAVGAFQLQRTPVTNGEYLAFVGSHTEWRRDRVAPVFAEQGYLAHWQAADELGANVDADQPVVSVSWFAARAYCTALGMRLPTEAEWEHAAAASRTRADGSADSAWRAEILSLYSRPNAARLPRVRAGAPNFWGIYDLHGVVWEWVSDFTTERSAFANGGGFCGATAGNATDTTDFAAFERVAFRTSLHANYTIRNLGFRCAADVKERVSK